MTTNNKNKKNPLNLFVIFTLVMVFASCRQNQIEGIFIDTTLYETQSITDNWKLRILIKQTLNKDEKSLAKLIIFPCGGGSGSYDLGYIFTQIIYRLGEKDFTSMVAKLDKKELIGLESLINVGLEYGYNDKSAEMDNKRIETEFPMLLKLIETKNQKETPNR